jgi:hypothetical protein
MFKLEHKEALVLLQMIEVNTFSGKDVPVLAKLIAKIQREAAKTAPRPDTDVTEEWVDPKSTGGSF